MDNGLTKKLRRILSLSILQPFAEHKARADFFEIPQHLQVNLSQPFTHSNHIQIVWVQVRWNRTVGAQVTI